MSIINVLSWNMQGRDLNWAYLAKNVDSDFALLQEVTYPSGYEDTFTSIIHHPKKKRAWGSAIISRKIKLTPHNNLNFGYWGFKLNGSPVVASTQGDNPLHLASIHAWHGVLETRDFIKNPLNGITVEDKNNIKEISVIRHLLAEYLADKRFIVGGDLNATFERDSKVLNNFLKLGFKETSKKFYDQAQPTFFKKGSRPSDLDHIFTDKKEYNQVASWQVLVEVATDLELSDHAPILMQYEM